MPSVLSQILGSIGVDYFFENIWCERPRAIRNPEYELPFSLEQFHQILNLPTLRHPQVQFFDGEGEISAHKLSDSQILEEDSLAIDIKSIPPLLEKCVTIRIGNVSEYSKTLLGKKSELEEAFGCAVHINAYLSTGPSRGLAPHYDPHHVFAYQVSGCKDWQLGDVIINEPTEEFLPAPTTSPKFKDALTLEQGDILYLPPGAWHQASTPDLSLHLTIGLHPPRWETWMSRTLNRAAKKHPILRAAIPMYLSQNEKCIYEANVDDGRSLFQLITDEIEELQPTDETSQHDELASAKDVRNRKENSADESAVSQQVDELIDHLWNHAASPNSIYLRGSFAALKRKHEPWDIDIYVVVSGPGSAQLDSTDNLRSLQSKFEALPRIDLSILDASKLLAGRESLLKRLLLIYEGHCVKGADLRAEIPVPAISAESAEVVRGEMKRFINKVLNSFEWTNRDLHGFSTEHFDLYTRSVAKSLIRAGTWVGMRESNVFSRDIEFCLSQLALKFDIEVHVTTLYKVLQGERMPFDRFISSATEVYQELYE